MLLPVQFDFLTLWSGIFLYTEMHYRFKYFPFSRYFRREPEILADAPFRLDPGKPLPVLILVKDADKYPIILSSIDIELISKNGNRKNFKYKKDVEINDRWWYETIFLDVDKHSGMCKINVVFTYEINGKIKSCINHNLKTSPEKPLSVFISNDPLPGVDKGWRWGDLHYHSSYTEDFVEFGAPLEATQLSAKALGLSFVCITDHSYDIDKLPDSWWSKDINLTKWKEFLKEVNELNKPEKPVLIPGEEVTTSNSGNKNVHTLVLNHPEFLPGSGDGAEKWFRTKTELSIKNTIKIKKENTLIIASHPREPFSFLGRLFLNRGTWHQTDLELNGLNGFEILNGQFNDGFYKGLNDWIDILLKKQKSFIYAGNDAHGNFNRFRQIKIPMLTTWNNLNYIFGKCRTGILPSGSPAQHPVDNIDSIIQSLKQGKCVISDGPLLSLIAENSTESVTLGDTINGSNIKIKIGNDSTVEFGELTEVTLYLGNFRTAKETVVFTHRFDLNSFSETLDFSYNFHGISGYIRGKLVSTIDERDHTCYTNPIWVNYPL